jgi:lysophospholipase L1-like esterase
MNENRKYFYRKYPGITMMVVVAVLTLGLLKVVDVVLYKRALKKQQEAIKKKEEQPLWIFSPINRIIRLRELRPHMSGFVQPTAEYLKEVENLENKKYWVHTDEEGFLIAPKTEIKEADKIVFLGGSTTECLYVTEEKRFPLLAAKKLEEKTGSKVIAKSGGVSGNHSLHAINILINKVIPQQPKAVVLMENINDLNLMLYEKTYWNKNINRSLIMDSAMIAAYNSQFPKEIIEQPAGWLKNIYPYLSLRYAVLKYKWSQTKDNTLVNEWSGSDAERIEINSPQLENAYRSSLKTFVAVCKAWRIVPVLMTQPNRITENPPPIVIQSFKPLEKKGLPYSDYARQYIRFNQIIREVAREENIILIDLDKLVPKDANYFYDSVHVNDKGSEFIAEVVSEHLKNIFLKQ